MKPERPLIHLRGTTGDDFFSVPLLAPTQTGSAQVTAGPGNDTIIVDFAAHVGAPVIYANGGPGDDWIDTSTLNSALATILGGEGDDTLIGSSAADTIRGGAGSDTIWMGGGDAIFADGFDRLLLDAYAGGGTVAIYGATKDTVFDFSSLSPPHLNSPSGLPLPEPFTITRSDLSFDAAGNLQVDHADPVFGSYHATLVGSPYHDTVSLDAAISGGQVILGS